MSCQIESQKLSISQILIRNCVKIPLDNKRNLLTKELCEILNVK